MTRNREIETSEIGKQYDRLTVIKFICYKFGIGPIFECRCICGNITSVRRPYLKSGHTRSCGCLARERVSQISFVDRTGKRFGRLTAIRVMPRENKKRINKWECSCDCGNIVIVTTSNLKSGHTRSCGCLSIEILKSRRIYPSKCKKWLTQIQHKYNLSPGDWTNLILRSNGKCEICSEQFKDAKSTFIDHDHKTGKVRGLLCPVCNFGLITLEDSKRLEQSHRYLFMYGSK